MTPILHFSSRKELGELPCPHDLAVCSSYSRFGLLDVFPHHQKSTLGSLSNGWKLAVGEFLFWGFVVCISLHVVGLGM